MSVPWFEHADYRNQFASILVETGALFKPEEILYFFEKPWKWDREYSLWRSYGQPDTDSESWDDFVAALDGDDEEE